MQPTSTIEWYIFHLIYLVLHTLILKSHLFVRGILSHQYCSLLNSRVNMGTWWVFLIIVYSVLSYYYKILHSLYMFNLEYFLIFNFQTDQIAPGNRIHSAMRRTWHRVWKIPNRLNALPYSIPCKTCKQSLLLVNIPKTCKYSLLHTI